MVRPTLLFDASIKEVVSTLLSRSRAWLRLACATSRRHHGFLHRCHLKGLVRREDLMKGYFVEFCLCYFCIHHGTGSGLTSTAAWHTAHLFSLDLRWRVATSWRGDIELHARPCHLTVNGIDTRARTRYNLASTGFVEIALP